MSPGLINVQIVDDNLKLKESILEHQSVQIVKDLQKRYDERYTEVEQIWEVMKQIEAKTI